MDMNHTGRFLIIAGILLAVIGVFLVFGKSLPIGRLPGDIYIKKENFSIYLPITTSIIISILFSLILYFTGKK